MSPWISWICFSVCCPLGGSVSEYESGGHTGNIPQVLHGPSRGAEVANPVHCKEQRACAVAGSIPWRAKLEGACIMGNLCGESHMPEMCCLFKEMTPESRLAIVQRNSSVSSASGTLTASPAPLIRCRPVPSEDACICITNCCKTHCSKRKPGP